jgi:hypothetical protein
MQDLQLVELFGLDASQDATDLIIKKSDLLGLISSSNNRAEELLTALLLTAIATFQGRLITENNEILVTENNEPISYDNSEDYFLRVNYWRKNITTDNGQQYIQHQIVIFQYTLYEAD